MDLNYQSEVDDYGLKTNGSNHGHQISQTIQHNTTNNWNSKAENLDYLTYKGSQVEMVDQQLQHQEITKGYDTATTKKNKAIFKVKNEIGSSFTPRSRNQYKTMEDDLSQVVDSSVGATSPNKYAHAPAEHT